MEQHVADLPDIPVRGSRRIDAGGEPICLVRTDEGTVKAVHDTCSHQEFPLSEGWIGDNEIECALHGSAFDLDTGAPLSLPAVRAVPVYACRVDGQRVLVDVERQLNDAPVPRH